MTHCNNTAPTSERVRNLILRHSTAIFGGLAGLLIAASAISAPLDGVYEEARGAKITITGTDGGIYRMVTDHSKFQSEVGHDWLGAGFLHKGKYIGVFKYKDDDSKYGGLAGYCEADIVLSSKTCITLVCVALKAKFSFGDQFNGSSYCKAN